MNVNIAWFIVGVSAASLTAFSFIPQILKILKTRSARDVSIAMLLQFLVGVSLWTAYGFHLKDVIIITGNLITLGSIIVLIVLYFKHRRYGGGHGQDQN